MKNSQEILSNSHLTTYVPPEWPDGREQQCDIVIVGEAPGASEVIELKPFIGAAGKLLRNSLKELNVPITKLLITNVFRYRPIDNKIENFFLKDRESKPVKNIITLHKNGNFGWCHPSLEHNVRELWREISVANPKIVIALGNTALWALTGKSGITKFRGSFLDTIPPMNAKVLATFHPSAILRQYSLLPVMKQDIKKAILLHNEEVEERTILIYPDLDDMNYFYDTWILPMRNTGAPLSFDIETARDMITCIGFAPNRKISIVVPFYHKGGNYWLSPYDEVQAYKWCKKILEDSEIVKLTQNGTYDITWLAEHLKIFVRGQLEDTMHIQHVLQPELKKDLGSLATFYSNERAWKSMVKFSKKKEDNDE